MNEFYPSAWLGNAIANTKITIAKLLHLDVCFRTSIKLDNKNVSIYPVAFRNYLNK